MKFIYHIFGIICYIIWSVIGIAIIIGGYSFYKSQPALVSSLMGTKNLTSVVSSISNAGNIGDLMQKIQSKKGDIAGAYNSLSKDQQTCLKTELGNDTITQALAGTLNFTPDLVLKASKCIK